MAASGLAAAAARHYLQPMPLPRPARPSVLWNDLRAFWKQRPRHQWVAGTLAVLIPIAIVFSFYLDSYTNVTPRQTIIYVNSWPATRTDAEIRAQQKADLAELRRRQAERQRQFKAIDDRLNRIGI
jgi:hypothetical protein